jgi:hypothetical protein
MLLVSTDRKNQIFKLIAMELTNLGLTDPS